MKLKLLAVLATTALAFPAMAQTTVLIGGTTLNGDLEAPSLGDFAGNHGGTISTSVFLSGAQSVCVDLTANNGEGQWKALCDTNNTNQSQIDVAFADDTKVLDAAVWVYVPAATSFGTAANTQLQINLEYSTTGTGGPYTNIPGSYKNLVLNTLSGAQKDTWIELRMADIPIPAGMTNVRTRPFNIATVQTLAGGTINASSTDSHGGTGLPMAVAADWIADGWNGFVYLDDFELVAHDPPPPPDLSIVMCDDIRNGDFESISLSPWNPAFSSGAIETTIVHGGAQSLSIDMAANNNANGTNRWKGMNLGNGTHPGVAGDRVKVSAWVYTPSTTTFGLNPSDRGNINFTLRSDKDGAGQGNQGQLFVNMKTMNKDVWEYRENTVTLADGTATVSSFNLGGWNVETENGQDQVALGYGGLIYIDDVKCINLGPPPPGVLVDDEVNNGDVENIVNPWTVNGAGSLSSAFDHTTGTGTSVKVDLTANNSNQQWKGLHTGGIEHPIETYTKADITAWVYIPSEANGNKFGPSASINFPIRDGAVAMPGGPSLNLTTAARDTWVKVEALDIDVSGFVTSLAVNNWNVQTEKYIGLPGSTVRSDGSDGTADTPVPADLAGPAVPQDWIDSGYEGCFYFDDISVRLHGAVVVPDIVINSISHDGVDQVTINYDTVFLDGVDVYYSDDNLSTWTADGFGATGVGQDLIRTSADPNRFYILVEPFAPAPPNPNP